MPTGTSDYLPPEKQAGSRRSIRPLPGHFSAPVPASPTPTGSSFQKKTLIELPFEYFRQRNTALRVLLALPHALLQLPPRGQDVSIRVAVKRNTGETCHRKGTVFFTDRNGTVRAVSISCAPVSDQAGEVIGGVEVFSDVTENYHLEKVRDSLLAEIAKISCQDPLTGAFNRRVFEDDLVSYWTGRNNMVCSLMMADLDSFEKINDTYGHPVGDRCFYLAKKAGKDCIVG